MSGAVRWKRGASLVAAVLVLVCMAGVVQLMSRQHPLSDADGVDGDLGQGVPPVAVSLQRRSKLNSMQQMASNTNGMLSVEPSAEPSTTTTTTSTAPTPLLSSQTFFQASSINELLIGEAWDSDNIYSAYRRFKVGKVQPHDKQHLKMVTDTIAQRAQATLPAAVSSMPFKLGLMWTSQLYGIEYRALYATQDVQPDQPSGYIAHVSRHFDEPMDVSELQILQPATAPFERVAVTTLTPSRMYRNKKQLMMQESTGEWRIYGYGMVCVHASDYDATGGFSMDIEGWGLEDEDLFKKLLTRPEFLVYRSVDRSTLHQWHEKVCDHTKLSAEQLLRCYKSTVQYDGTKFDVARMYGFFNAIGVDESVLDAK
ncbi:hypothetical protein PTSG_00810 [Salpingoeca rosetta]|uniref:Hexosyltransferase n=1 Tax=Salpingoeca rosetta (strain ATCC 50818 / BSB-021) TaxID=946362 RepID=F2TXJ5_SALR5|nr:uncharacterized protein PTSG_00810 [Salpingoeca rosetta]EGD76104.1 hypothetical protein PTSG_00810 [Salpingoeca rosetta]|eukprot:XP_004998279.1 hypothetical protein PTSG_00810 [Salpingoeca rosetta]